MSMSPPRQPKWIQVLATSTTPLSSGGRWPSSWCASWTSGSSIAKGSIQATDGLRPSCCSRRSGIFGEGPQSSAAAGAIYGSGSAARWWVSRESSLSSLTGEQAMNLASKRTRHHKVDMNDTQSELLTLLLVATIIFLIPTIIAFLRRHPNRWVIFLLNTFLGATGIVWFGCLIWACKAIHITADPRGTNGGESGLNLTANDVVWVRFENVAPLSPPVSRLPSEDMLNRLERLKKLRDDGAIDADQFERMRAGVFKAG
ncbi:hypothetical protein CK215_30560 [Mesorhizobium sp. WSM3864]|nr:hypothetical protein CK215_30560 [Mesorhizobium sp. WSM3864]